MASKENLEAAEGGDDNRPKLFHRMSASTPNLNVNPDFDPFDPALRRNAPGSITNIEALIHLIKSSLGTGILAMAHGFTYVGSVVGLLGTFMIIAILAYCIHLLLRAQYFQTKRLGQTLIEYPDCAGDAFEQGPALCKKVAPAMPYVVDFFLLFYQLGICSCYFIFIAFSIKQVADVNGFVLSNRVWMIIILIPIMMMNLIRDLHLLSPVSTAGNIAFALAMCVIYYYLLGYDGSALSKFSKRPHIVLPPYNWPLFIGMACFATEAPGIILKIEHNMKKPKSFRAPLGVFNVGTALVSVLYAMTGLLGYLKYGPAVESSITLNLPSDQILAQCVKLLYAFVIFFSYPLQNFVPLELLWVNYIKQHMAAYSEKKKLYIELILREVVVLITWAVAMVIPRLDLLIALFGAFCLSTLGIIFPAMINIIIIKKEGIGFGPFNWRLYFNYVILVFGTFVMISGTIISTANIIKAII